MQSSTGSLWSPVRDPATQNLLNEEADELNAARATRSVSIFSEDFTNLVLEDQRVILVGLEHQGENVGFCDNTVSSAQYNVFSFLPLNLYQQFQRVANVYFAMCFLLFVMSVDDKFNRSGFNRFTFADETPDVTAVGGLPTCDTYYMPECATPLAIVHDSTDAAADADSMAAVAEVTEQLLAANAQVRT